MNPSGTDKPYLSVSQLELHAKCPEAYRRRYIEGDKQPPGFAALRGSAVHSAAEGNLHQKLETRQDLPVLDIVDWAAADFEDRVQQGVTLNDEEASRGLKVVKGETLDVVARLARLHALLQAPEYQPQAVEEAVRVSLPGASRDLLCVIDVVDDQDTLADFKTTAKAKTPQDAAESLQLTAYHFAWKAKTGKPPASLRLDVTVVGGEVDKRQKLETLRTASDVVALGHRFDAVGRSIDAGSFAPPLPGVWWCSPKFCGYWRTCPFIGGSQKQAD